MEDLWKYGPWGIVAAIVVALLLFLGKLIEAFPAIVKAVRFFFAKPELPEIRPDPPRRRAEDDGLDTIEKYAFGHMQLFSFRDMLRILNAKSFSGSVLRKIYDLRHDPIQNTEIILDFTETIFISSAGLGALILIASEVAAANSVVLRMKLGYRLKPIYTHLKSIESLSQNHSIFIELIDKSGETRRE